MEIKSIGLLETNSVAKGVECADEMIKTADVELIMARTTCPGRYTAMISGEVAAVQNSIDVGKDVAGEFLVDTFVIPNVHSDLFPALSCASKIGEIESLGIIETYTVASCITAADAAAKSAAVQLIEIRCATGLAGKSFVTLTGDVGSVRAAVDAGVNELEDQGLIQSYVVIPSPSKELYASLV
jgi:microcompartment protein CcmL/EutN